MRYHIYMYYIHTVTHSPDSHKPHLGVISAYRVFSSIICVKVNFLLNSYSEQILPKKLFSFEMFLP